MGVGSASSLGTFRKELSVDDLPRRPSLEFRGEELVEALEPCRKSGTGEGDFAGEARAGDAKGERNSCPSGLSVDSNRKDCTAGDSATRFLAELFTDAGGANDRAPDR